MSTLTISIDRTALTLSALVLSGVTDANPIGVTNYTEPAYQARVAYAPDSEDQHGSVPLAYHVQQSILGFEIVTDQAASEAASRTLVQSVRTAITQALTFEVTVTVDGAPPETYTCNPGSMVNAGRSYADMLSNHVVWSVSLPCHPIPEV